MQDSAPTAPCPSCKKKASLGTDNPHRPFCSQRCQHLDLAGWLDESFVISEPAPFLPSHSVDEGLEH